MSGVILAIVGCRDHDDKEGVFNIIDKYIAYHKLTIEKIISGDSCGVDHIAEDYAMERGYAFQAFPADWDTHGNAAGPIRNTTVVEELTHLLAFWDQASRGTGDTIDKALKARKFTTTIKITPTGKKYWSRRAKAEFEKRKAA